MNEKGAIYVRWITRFKKIFLPLSGMWNLLKDLITLVHSVDCILVLLFFITNKISSWKVDWVEGNL